MPGRGSQGCSDLVQYHPGTCHYNSAARAPAWTDRILWKTRSGVTVQQSYYSPVTNVTTSDHKPLMAAYRIGLARLMSVPTWHRLRQDARASGERSVHKWRAVR